VRSASVADAPHTAQPRAASQQSGIGVRAMCALLPFAFMLAAPLCDAIARAV